jgi:hypothetical protein
MLLRDSERPTSRDELSLPARSSWCYSFRCMGYIQNAAHSRTRTTTRADAAFTTHRIRKNKYYGTNLRTLAVPSASCVVSNNLTPNPFPRGKGNRIEGRGKGNRCLARSLASQTKKLPNRDEVPHLFRSLGAGVTPAGGGVEPIAGSTFNNASLPRSGDDRFA